MSKIREAIKKLKISLPKLHPRNHRCEWTGCKNEGQWCVYHDGGGSWLCDTHLREAGFCPGCLMFWGGVESFEFSRTGFCEECELEFEMESARDDNEFDYEMDSYDDDSIDWDWGQ
jgi:hypothetical protein